MVPAIVQRAAAVARADSTGVVSYRIHQTSAAAGGPLHFSSDVVLLVVADGPTIVRVKVLRLEKNGSQEGDAEKRSVERDVLAGQSKGGFAVPFDARHFGEYRYAAQGATVRFRALVRDGDHGDGTFTVDGSGHVTGMAYVPTAYPKYATGGTVVVTRAEVLPGFWASTRTDQEYDGRYLFVHGHDSTITVADDFHRYATVEQAERVLAGGASR